MKKFFLAIFALGATALSAGEFDPEASTSYVFGSMSGIDGYPMVGGGVRLRHQSHILELAANVAPANRFSPVVYHAKALYLLCPSKKGMYLGAGAGMMNETESYGKREGTIESSLGYEWITSVGKRGFIEMNNTYPMRERKWDWDHVDFGITLGLGY